MRHVLLLFILFSNLCVSAQDTLLSTRLAREIDSLISTKCFFRARALYEQQEDKLIEFDRLLIGTSLDNVFNKPAASNAKIARLRTGYEKLLTDSTKYALLNIEQGNYSRLFMYREANAAANEVLKLYTHLITEKETEDLKNTNRIWAALADQPMQEIIFAGKTEIKLEKDKAGLSNLRVKCGKRKENFIFDTGANLSTVTESIAKKFNMKILDATIDVTSITGLKVKSKIAICPRLTLENIMIKNAVFLVFPDEALAVPQIKYQINGIIGFPVIEALGEIQITRDGRFIVPEKIADKNPHNLALDFLTPVIELNGESYSFDSGADVTMLYATYFNQHKDSITGKYEETEYHFGGAGGSITKKGFYIPFTTTINGKTIRLEKVIVFTENIKESGSLFYGNIGQDLIGQFDRMILNFRHMYIAFE